MRTYLRLLLKPKRYLIGENEADILETFLKKKWSPETISSVCFDKKISHQTIYNYIEHERQLGGTLYRYLFFKRRRRKYGIKDYRGQIRNRVSIENRPEIVAERSRFGDWEGDLIMGKNHKGAILTRQYFPKGMDLRKATERELKFALNEINSRPRKTLNWKSPSDYLHELKCAAP